MSLVRSVFRPRVPLVLASASPRRRQLLKQAGLHFRVVPSQYQEGRAHGDPGTFARRVATAKAQAVACRLRREAWVLAADTLVVKGSQVFGKPRSRVEARRMLRALAGGTHVVLTAVCLYRAPGGESLSWVERTRVRMRSIASRELEAYLDSHEWQGKAGAYGIQGRAGAFVTGLSGCYFNVVGLPLGSVCRQLSQRGIGPW